MINPPSSSSSSSSGSSSLTQVATRKPATTTTATTTMQMHPSSRSSLSLVAALQQQRREQQPSLSSSSSSSFQATCTSLESRKRLEGGSLTAQRNHRLYAQHKYHDFVNVTDDDDDDNDKSAVNNRSKTLARPCRKIGGGVAVPFPVKLHDALDCIQNEGRYLDVVSWQPHGRCFIIRQPKVFVSTVLPRYFFAPPTTTTTTTAHPRGSRSSRSSGIKLTSFQRQLNLYGFGRITAGPDAGAYYHELFLRGKRFLAWHMARTRVKGTKIKFASNPAAEPNFYRMPPAPDPYTKRVTTKTKNNNNNNHSGKKEQQQVSSCIDQVDDRDEPFFDSQPSSLSMVANTLPVPPAVILEATPQQKQKSSTTSTTTTTTCSSKNHHPEDDKQDDHHKDSFLARVLLMLANQQHQHQQQQQQQIPAGHHNQW